MFSMVQCFLLVTSVHISSCTFSLSLLTLNGGGVNYKLVVQIVINSAVNVPYSFGEAEVYPAKEGHELISCYLGIMF